MEGSNFSSLQGDVLPEDHMCIAALWRTELTCKSSAATKAELARLFEARQVIQFAEFYPVGHRSTNYKKFFESDVPYPIKFKSGYEPYVLVSRKHMPWYDERFRGYGWDKVKIFPAVSPDCSVRFFHVTVDLN